MLSDLQFLKGWRRNIPVAIILALTLSACSTNALDTAIPGKDFTYLATLEINTEDSSADLSARYGGEIITYKPGAGFAILGFSKEAGEMSLLSDSLEDNSDLGVTELAHASGFSAWASGFSAWASGFNAWASGFSAWASGQGSRPELPAENQAVFDLIELDEALALSTNKGAGVKVAVIDTGLDLDHSLLASRLVPASQWRDFVDDDNRPEDVKQGNAEMFGHGTAVAGVIAQVAPRAKILPIRVLKSNGSGNLNDVISAIDWAVSQNADVINLSLGTNANPKSLETMVKYAAEQRVHVVIASGNAGKSGMDRPATYANSWNHHDYILSVASMTEVLGLKSRSTFSNYGGNLEFLTPGENVFSFYPGDTAGSFTGTSFAAPLIAGMVALDLAEGATGPAETRLAAVSTSIPGDYNGHGLPSAAKLMGAY